ncbi:uncharacterized protein (TIGR02444 family) [Chromohalobacter marismortui]|uniref:Uncharacterized protein (TIGR02444 family) n=1 Tax=Chromohalobacter marismortui TaxID=42055 RepID=A0A4R7NFC6_9GAMM|nr:MULTISPECIES: TIGR02444 family protein [Chromohalobacter]MCI0510015.1 TIGR02444 family protein [Chromohalobacter sp.]MCI0593826.1 TIGR02444 family protein [Chromohalobacter sp.]TDU19017.1 uncharacterized protein (TIGR02444 family) [Chromohalobacter marismortui]
MHSTQLCDVLRNPPLWDYALALYQLPEVADACLQLQDEAGADVCELLWRCWLDRHALVPTDEAHSAVDDIRAWQAEVTQPIRHLRRTLKPRAQHHQQVATLRTHLKEAELLAERETLRQFQTLSETSHAVRTRQPDDASLTMQLTGCLAMHAPAQNAALATLTTQHRTLRP